MRKVIFVLLLVTTWVFLSTFGWAAVRSQEKGAVKISPKIADISRMKISRMPYLVLAQVDLQVAITGPATATAGEDIALTVTVKNVGTVNAPGSIDHDYWKSYYVDLILSADASIPMEPGVQPVYTGHTENDFVEDMLIMGGRISNTFTIPPGGQHVYTISVYLPRDMDPKKYYIGAVVDPFKAVKETNESNNIATYGVNILAAKPSTVHPPAGVGFWVMPYAVGNTPINVIKATGLVDYTDGLSGYAMNDAPFGSRLGFRLGYQNALPTPEVYYYRWSYQKEGTAGWTEFTEPVGVHYVRELGMEVSFPVYQLGPKPVAGKNLYEFRPHLPPAEPPAVTHWPVTDWFGDIYSGFLSTTALPDGKYRIKVEIFSQAGIQVMPGPLMNTFIVPNGTDAAGTILTRLCNPATELDAGGFVFPLYIDNRACTAYIEAPTIGTKAASDTCGFLLYGPGETDVNIAYNAVHPGGRAVYQFLVVRGINYAVNVSGEVYALSVPPFTGDGAGMFWNTFNIFNLMSTDCPDKAAFSENLHVYAKATTGWHQRLNYLDAYYIRAFAIAPE